MKKISTLILDINDDDGELLKNNFTWNELPEQIKTANFSQDHDDWALVIDVDGTEFKKFACNDEGNTAVSLVYFLNNYEKLPEEAVKIAAVNLVDSMGRFNLYIPPELKELANKYRKDGEVFTKNKWKQVDSLGDIDMFSAGHKLAMVKEAKYLLLNKYPVDTHEQVKQASTYFEEYWKDFSPEERREYCTGLEKRAKDILAPISNKIADWTGNDYGDRVENFIEQRKRLVPEEERSTLDMLLEKKAFVEAPTFAEALKEFDLVNGLENQWDHIGDPYVATFSKTAKAEKFWYYETDEGRIYERDLKLLARATQRLQEQFGKEFTNKFTANPKTVFNEASENTKKVLVTMCLSVYNRS